jgi:glycosyltransferase involved in cell wall biosynthesis
MTITTISVLICTYNRASLLRETLAALQAQEPPADCNVEIIVVDNNSTDNTPAVVAESAADGTFPIVSLREPRQGKSFALNTGLAHASGEVLALTDDDVLPGPRWLRRIVEHFRPRDVAFVFGKVLPRWGRTPPPELLTAQAQAIWGPLAIVDYGDTPADYLPDSCSQRLPVGANLAFARSALVTIGGWRTDLGKVNNTLVSGEDHEIFMRLRRFGLYAGYYDPQLTVRHFVPAGRLTRAYFRRWFFWHGKTQALMLDDLYPELDMTAVPRIAGVPRFAYRQAAQQFWRWLRTVGNSDAVNTLAQELSLIEYAGLFAQCWRQALTPQRAPLRRPPLGASAVGTSLRLAVLAAVLNAIAAAPTAAPSVRLSIQDGRVWLTADRASVGEILAEWARVGQTQIANAERVQSGPLTLQLNGMPEPAALDLLLRSAGGYVAVEREASRLTAPTMSRYGRIVIVPASAGPADAVRFAATPTPAPAPAFIAPQPPPPVPASVETSPGERRLIGPDGVPVPDDQDDAPPPMPTSATTPPRGRGGLR